MPARKDPFHELCQYWEVTDAENPTFRDIYEQNTEGIQNYPGIIFMTDSTFLENPKATMRYGKFVLKGKVINAQFDDGKKAVFTIQDLQNSNMVVRRVEHSETLVFISFENIELVAGTGCKGRLLVDRGSLRRRLFR